MSSPVHLRLFYFFYYGSVGASLPYFAPYLRGLGFSGKEIGTVQMLGPLFAAPAALIWAAAADRLGSPSRVLRVASLWTLIAIGFLPLARTAGAVAAVMVAQSLAASALIPLVDSVSMEWARSSPGRSYPRLRLFGSLGFIALAQAMGLALTARGELPGDRLVPLAMVLCVAGYAMAARQLTSVPPAGERPRFIDMLSLLRDRNLLFLLLACAVHWGSCAPFHLMFGLFVQENGLTASITGSGAALGVGAEVAILLAFPFFERRFTTYGMLALSFAGTVVRWLLLSISGGTTAIVALQLLHGLTFGLFWGAAIQAMSERVPPRLRATGQALFSTLVFAAGNAVGYQLTGLGYDHFGAVAPLYGLAGLAELVPLGMVLALGWAARAGFRAQSQSSQP